MVFNATFNNISVISLWLILLVGETGGLVENHRPIASYWQTSSRHVVHLALIEIHDHDGPFKVLDKVYKTMYHVWNLTYFYILVHSLGKLNCMESDWTEDKI
jgi:hypothetical protein